MIGPAWVIGALPVQLAVVKKGWDHTVPSPWLLGICLCGCLDGEGKLPEEEQPKGVCYKDTGEGDSGEPDTVSNTFQYFCVSGVTPRKYLESITSTLIFQCMHLNSCFQRGSK